VGLARDAGAHEHDTGVSVGRIEREGDWKTGMHADASDRRSLAQSRLPATFHVSVPPVAWRRTRYASTRPHNLDPRPNATISPLSWKRRREQDVRQFPPATTAAKVNRIWRIGQFTLSYLMLPGENPCLCRPSHGNSRRAQVIRARDRRHSDGAKTPQYVFVRVEFYRCDRRRRHAGRASPERRACRRGGWHRASAGRRDPNHSAVDFRTAESLRQHQAALFLSWPGLSRPSRFARHPHRRGEGAGRTWYEATRVPLAPPLPACGERSGSKRSEAERRNPGEGAVPHAQNRGQAPSPDLLRCARAPLASRPLPARGERWSKWPNRALALPADSNARAGYGGAPVIAGTACHARRQ